MHLDKKKFQSILGIVVIGITLFWALNNLSTFFQLFQKTVNLLLPFILGVSLAFILNIPVSSLEKRLLKRKRLTKHARGISVVITLLVFVITMFLLFLFIIPELASSLDVLFQQLPKSFETIQNFIISVIDKYPNYEEMIQSLNIDYSSISSSILSFGQGVASSFINSVFGFANGFMSGMISLFIAVPFSIYIIFQKEKLKTQAKRICYAFLPEPSADYIIRVSRLSLTTFRNFITGQGLEAIILGVLYFVAMTIFRMPYALLISIIIAVTSVVPMFGPMFSSFLGSFLILMVNPLMALWFYIMFQMIQQFEDNFIYPRVVGQSVGLPSIWVLFSLTFGGRLFGLVGMIISIPTFSVFYVLLSEVVEKKLRNKNIDQSKVE